MSDPDEVERLAIAALQLSEADQRRLLEILSGAPRFADLQMLRYRRLRAFKAAWLPDMSDRGAAEWLARELARLDAAGYRRRASPAITDARRAELFEILTSGPTVGAERIRQILRGG
jgi:hypothetical protein